MTLPGESLDLERGWAGATGAAGGGVSTATGSETGSGWCGTGGRYRPGTASDWVAGVGNSLTAALGRTLMATATASVAKLTTRKATALPINTMRGGAGVTAAVYSVASASCSGINSPSGAIGISSYSAASIGNGSSSAIE